MKSPIVDLSILSLQSFDLMDSLWVLVAGIAGVIGGYFIAVAILRARNSGSSDLLQTKVQEIEDLRKGLSEAQTEKAKFEERAGRVEALETERGTLNEKIAQLSSRVATLEAEKLSLEETKKFLEEAERELKEAFLAASTTALEKNNARFLELANEKFDALKKESAGDLEQRKQAIGQLLQPIKESLEKVDKQIQDIEKTRVSAYSGLTEQVKSLMDSQSKLQTETGNLVRALRSPSYRGRWGEIQLENIVRMAGMVERCDFDRQTSTETEEGRRRPDLIIHLPNSQKIVVDSKAPIESYLDAHETDDEDQRLIKLQNHARLVKDHIQKLSSKSYWENYPSAEFVVLFLPLEPAFSAALQVDPGLIEYGVQNRVILATPTTLIALLKAVAYGWRQEQLADNAQKISDLGKDLYKRIADMAGHFQSLGKNLDRAVDSYNKSIRSMETRVLPQARRFKELQASTGEDIDEMEPIDKVALDPQSPELKVLPEVTHAVGLFQDGGSES